MMTEVVAIDAVYAGEAMTTTGPDQRLRFQSRLLSELFSVLFWGAALGIALAVGVMAFRVGSIAGIQDGGFAFSFPLRSLHDDMGTDFVPAASLPFWESTLTAGLLAARLLPGLYILWRLRVLFWLYSQGRVFSADNARQIRWIAIALLIYAAIPLFTHGALFLVQLAATPVRMQIRQVDALVLGLVLFTVARVMAFGYEIERDRAGFI